ncbi:MAG: DUF2797 domain-containing protein [Bacteriovoracaceae bacterium]
MTGTLSKMQTSFEAPVIYKLMLSEVHFDLTSMVGKNIKLNHSGKIFCINCGAKTKKSYSQGYCYPCTMKLAECDLCIVRPETCHYDKGTCREPKWGEENCFKSHIVYLANSSGIKVGITRKTQIPTRWIDQGAHQALPILEVKNRFVSGQIEVLFKKFIADKTDWRKMLKGKPEEVDLVELRDQLFRDLSDDLAAFEVEKLDSQVWNFVYPVEKYPLKVNSISLDKVPKIDDKLIGIKGQYLIFENGVLNVRSHAGYEVEIVGE